MKRLLWCYCWLGLSYLTTGLSSLAYADTSVTPTAEKRILTIGIPLARRPYAFLDAHKQPTGLLVSITQRVCETIKADCQFTAGGSDQLLQDLQASKLNALIVVDHFIVPEVDKVKLTPPLCKLTPSFIQKADAPARVKPEDFQGVSLAVQEGSIFHIYALDTYSSQARLKPYPFMDNAVFDLVSGRLDVLFADAAFIQSRITNTSLQGYIKFTTTPLDAQLSITAMTIAVRDQDSDLLDTLNTALTTVGKEQTCAQWLEQLEQAKQSQNRNNH